MKKPRLKDIAHLAGVSESAVSLVLNNAHTRISEKKKEEIREIAKELNYVPNYAARSLSTKKSQTIGLIIPDIENPYFSSMSKYIEDLLRDEGYLVFIVNSNDRVKNDVSLLNELVHRMVDGIMICPSNEAYEDTDKMVSILKQIKVPLVILDRIFKGANFNQVSFDNELGGYLATKHLIDSGAREIACFTGSLLTENGQQRLQGYKRALVESGHSVDATLIFEGDYQFETGYQLGLQVLDKNKVDGVFSSNDLMAFGLLRSMAERGYDQEKIKVVGYDNLKQSTMFGVSLKSVDQNIENLSRNGVDLMLRIIANEKEIESVVLKPTLK